MESLTTYLCMHAAAPFIFAIAVGLLIYLVAGYPLLLAAFPFRCRPVVRKDFKYRRPVSVLLPVFNGEAHLAQKLESILALDYPKDLLEILVISDGSTDQTDEIAAGFRAAGVQVIRIPHAGKAAAINAGLARATGEILFFTDVRQRLAPDSLSHLVACLADPEVGTATGELEIAGDGGHEQADMGLYWRYEVWARKKMSRIDSMFGATGCIYAMRRELATQIPADTLVDDAFLPMHAFLRGYRTVLEPAARAFDDSFHLDLEFDRRRRTLAGLWQLLVRCPELITSRDRMWLHFVSHKFSRLILPYLAVLAVVSSFWLDAPWRGIALSSTVAILALSLLDSMLPEKWALRRLTSPFRTTLVMMTASLCAVSVFFGPPERLWRPTRVRES